MDMEIFLENLVPLLVVSLFGIGLLIGLCYLAWGFDQSYRHKRRKGLVRGTVLSIISSVLLMVAWSADVAGLFNFEL